MATVFKGMKAADRHGVIRALLFDLDNTLYAYEACNTAGKRALKYYLQRQLQISGRDFEKFFMTARQQVHHDLPHQAAAHSRLLYIQKILEVCEPRSLQLQLWQRAHTVFWQAYFKKMRLRPGLRQLLRQARQRGYQIAIVTNLTTDIQIKKIQRLGIARYIDVIVTSEEVGKEKPHPAMVRRALRKLHCRSAAALMIGDDDHDRQVAQRCGITFYQLNNTTSVRRLAQRLF